MFYCDGICLCSTTNLVPIPLLKAWLRVSKAPCCPAGGGDRDATIKKGSTSRGEQTMELLGTS